MTRSPLAAWRRLFAIGGAPAASHVTLSRAPSSDRLLEPLSGARIARATAFEALAKPLDIGAVLAKVATGSAAGVNGSAEQVVERSRTRNVTSVAAAGESRAPSRIASSDEVGSRSRAPRAANAMSELPRARRALASLADATTNAVKRFGVMHALDDRQSSHPSREVFKPAARNAGRSVDAPALPSTVTAEDRRNDSNAGLTNEPHNAAKTRIIVNQATPDVIRILEFVDRTQGAAMPRSPEMHQRPTESTGADAGERLAAAVSRARHAIAATKNIEPTLAPLVNERASAASTLEPTRTTMTNPSTATEAAVNGGFRGLAQRTLTTSRASSTVAPQRIEPEARLSGDLAIDTLDSRVADSLARILEREARRHGIDIDEARS